MRDRQPAPTVLFVADDPRAAADFEARLAAGEADQGESWQVRGVTCAAAVAIARRAVLDVTVIDADAVDAIDVVSDLRHAAPTMAIVALSRATDAADERDLLRAGAHEVCVVREDDPLAVVRALRKAMARQSAARSQAEALRDIGVPAVRWPLLEELSRVAAAAASAGDALNGAVQVLVPAAADCAVIALLEQEIVVAVRHVDREVEQSIRSAIDDWLLDAMASSTQGDKHARPTVEEVTEEIVRALTTGGVAVARPAEIRLDGELCGVLLIGAAEDPLDTEGPLARAAVYRLASALERAAALQHARSAVAARDRAISIVSHDLVTPLTTIQMGASALLRSDPANAAFTRHVAELVERSATLMQQILHDLLDQASLDSGQLRLARQPALIEPIVDTVHDSLARLAEERQILFVCSSPADTPLVDADPERLLQVLFNLVANAIKFTSAGGRVELAVRSVQRIDLEAEADREQFASIRFVVQDTGSGIPADELPHVFEWYWRSPESPRSGTGLGLAIAHALIGAHGSELHVDSVAGQGTTFWFDLPPAAGGGRGGGPGGVGGAR